TILCKYLKIELQRVKIKDNWILTGLDEDLNQAMKIAVQQTVNWLSTQKMAPMSREEAYALTSMVGDCRVTEVVDIRKGVHCMISKSIFIAEKRQAQAKNTH